jgi:nucleoside-diphosphate-sugar epimerase
MIVLVTGAAGGIGSRLVAALRADSHRVRALQHRREVDGDEIVRGDLRDAASIARATAGVDAVIHLAAVTHARNPAAYEVNVTGTRALVDAYRGRIVHVSTRAIDSRGGAYSASKARAEGVARGSRQWVIVRLPEVYGANGSEGIDGIIERARRGSAIPIVGRGDDEVCPVHVEDAVSALVTALGAPARRTYTLAGECTTIRGFTEDAVRLLGSSSRIIGVPTPAVALVSRLARVLPLPLYPDQLARLRAPKESDASAARADLGFEPRRLDEGLRRA